MAKIDIYQAVTDRILELLDKGTVPWRHPVSGAGGDGFPKNLASGKPYRGINVFLLACTAMTQGYGSSYWLTYRQAKERGGQVRKGEKSSLVVFWKKYKTEDRETGEDKTVPVIRHYNVFNAEQCDGIEAPDLNQPDKADAPPFEPIEEAARIVKGYAQGPAVITGGHQACYQPLADTVRMPEAERFESPESYYATLFHELVHSTGHSSRLDRGLDKNLRPFGSPDYSKEELIAEMGAAFLAAAAGISPQTIEQSAAYIDGWRRKLKGDKKLVIQASGAGQRASDRILGVTWDEASNTMREARVSSAALQQAPATNDNPSDADSDDQVQLRKLKAALQAFPRPGQANLNSTATTEQRSAFIGAVLGWWNDHVDDWVKDDVLDPSKNPAAYRPGSDNAGEPRP